MGGTQVCDECYESFYFHDKLCWTECPEHTFSYEGQNHCYGIYIYIYIYIYCDPTCKNCSEGTESSCINCYSDRIFTPELNSCITECPPGFFKFTPPAPIKATCIKCDPSCQLCTSITNCSACNMNYYPVRDEWKCVVEELCPEGTYPDQLTQICENCNHVCKSCVGPGSEDCIVCNYIEGLVKKNKEYISGCIELCCSKGYFEEILEDLRHICTLCHPSCEECSGTGVGECLTCPNSRKQVVTTLGIFCNSCEEIHPGLIGIKEEPRTCTEICGDGRNMGILQCDDGNLLDGDGCDSQCRIENGYSCDGGGEDLSDVCVDITQPNARILSITLNYTLIIVFTKLIAPISITHIYIHIYIYI